MMRLFKFSYYIYHCAELIENVSIEILALGRTKSPLRDGVETTPFWKFQVWDPQREAIPALFSLAVNPVEGQHRFICD